MKTLKPMMLALASILILMVALEVEGKLFYHNAHCVEKCAKAKPKKECGKFEHVYHIFTNTCERECAKYYQHKMKECEDWEASQKNGGMSDSSTSEPLEVSTVGGGGVTTPAS